MYNGNRCVSGMCNDNMWGAYVEMNDICKQNNRTFWIVFGITSSKPGQRGDQPVQTGPFSILWWLEQFLPWDQLTLHKVLYIVGIEFPENMETTVWIWFISVDLSWSPWDCSWNPANWRHFYPSYLHTRKRAKFRATNMGGNKHSASKEMSTHNFLWFQLANPIPTRCFDTSALWSCHIDKDKAPKWFLHIDL